MGLHARPCNFCETHSQAYFSFDRSKNVSMTVDNDADYDDFYGCACQRYLFLGLMSPIILALSLIGLISLTLVLPCKDYYFSTL